jgi:hypothetical protein
MKKSAMIALAALTFGLPVVAVSGNSPTASGAKPSSFVPHPHAHNRVYGSPIAPAIVGHRTASHQKRTLPNRSSFTDART